MLETHYDCPCLDRCPLHYAMSIIGGKWKMQIICALNNRGTLRYNELRRKMDGISNTVLATGRRRSGHPQRIYGGADPCGIFHDGTLRQTDAGSRKSQRLGRDLDERTRPADERQNAVGLAGQDEKRIRSNRKDRMKNEADFMECQRTARHHG